MVVSVKIMMRIFYLVSFGLYGCTNNSKDIKYILSKDNNSLIDKKYSQVQPIAQIINPENHTNKEVLFELEKDASIKVYGSGELLYNFADVESKYYLLSDDIELFFKIPKSPGAITKSEPECQLVLSLGEAKADEDKYLITLKDSTQLKGFVEVDSLKRKKFLAEIRVPWKRLGIIQPKEGDSILFDIALGDTDLHFVQEGKVAWVNSKEPLNNKYRKYGTIFLNNKLNSNNVRRSISSVSGKPLIDWKIDDLWKTLPPAQIENVVAGVIKDKYDLSGKVVSAWDQEYLYFFVTISDQNQNQVVKSKIAGEQTFIDYGWIEDDKGKKVWEMNVVNSKYAGGAFKNHCVDTLLYLKKGKYTLKYTSDESHAYNNWDDQPPLNGFYGIVIYKPKEH